MMGFWLVPSLTSGAAGLFTTVDSCIFFAVTALNKIRVYVPSLSVVCEVMGCFMHECCSLIMFRCNMLMCIIICSFISLLT